jgi:hypothetical protein
MIKEFSSYTVQRRNKKFTLRNGVVLSKTATVSFLNNKDELISSFDLGFVDAEFIYQLIEKNQPVNLQDCYIEGFSLAIYREKRNLQRNRMIRMAGFVATNSILSSDTEIDFSFCTFSSGRIDFSNSVFLQGDLIFDQSDFGNRDVQFNDVHFYTGNISFSNASFGRGTVSFKHSLFGEGTKNFQQTRFDQGNVVFERVKFGNGNLEFDTASFGEGNIDFTRSSFGSGEISFNNTQLGKGDLLFVNSDFHAARLSFKSTHFNEGKVDFHYSNFGQGDLIFDRAIIGRGIIDFSATEFKTGKISFNRTEFGNNELNFESSELESGKIVFKNIVFSLGTINCKMMEYGHADIIFNNVNFGDVTGSFERSKINSLIFNTCHLNGYFNLELVKCNSLDLSNTVVRDILDMKSHVFKVDLQSINLSGLLLQGQIHLDWKASRLKELIIKQETSQRNKSEQFRILKENYHSLGQYKAEDEAYVAFKQSQAKADLEESISQGSLFRKVTAHMQYGFKWLIFDKIGHYATNPARVLLSMVFTYLFFVLLYFILPLFVDTEILPSFDRPETLTHLGKAFYHSVVTFLTIGYGDYYPSGIFKWISGIEGFAGLFMISYFTVAFVRKVLR